MPPSSKNIMKHVRIRTVATPTLCLSIIIGPAILAAFGQTQAPTAPPRQTFTPPYAAPGGPAYSSYGEASTSHPAPPRAPVPSPSSSPSGYAPNPTLQFQEGQRSQSGVAESRNSSPPPPASGVGFSEPSATTTPQINPAPATTQTSPTERALLPSTEQRTAPESGSVHSAAHSEPFNPGSEIEPVVYDRPPIPSAATPIPAFAMQTPSVAETSPSPTTSIRSASPGITAQTTGTSPELGSGSSSRSTPQIESKASNILIQPPSDEDGKSENAFSDGHPFLTMGASLLLVLGGFFVLAWFIRRMAPQAQRPLPREVVEVLGRSPLGPRRQLQLIRFGGKLVLTSISNDGVQPISELTDPDEVQQLVQQCRRKAESETTNETQPGFRQFVDRFKHQTSQKTTTQQSATTQHTTTPRQSTTSEGGPQHGAHATPAPHETEQDDDSAINIDNLAGIFAESRQEGYSERSSRSVPLSDLRSM